MPRPVSAQEAATQWYRGLYRQPATSRLAADRLGRRIRTMIWLKWLPWRFGREQTRPAPRIPRPGRPHGAAARLHPALRGRGTDRIAARRRRPARARTDQQPGDPAQSGLGLALLGGAPVRSGRPGLHPPGVLDHPHQPDTPQLDRRGPTRLSGAAHRPTREGWSHPISMDGPWTAGSSPMTARRCCRPAPAAATQRLIIDDNSVGSHRLEWRRALSLTAEARVGVGGMAGRCAGSTIRATPIDRHSSPSRSGPAIPKGSASSIRSALRTIGRAGRSRAGRRCASATPLNGHHVSDYGAGDVHIHLHDREDQAGGTCDLGMATAAAMFRLSPGRPRRVSASIPLEAEEPAGTGWVAGWRANLDGPLPGGSARSALPVPL